ncbi:TPA: Acylphosphatase-2 [Trebouxia sp. C0004]
MRSVLLTSASVQSRQVFTRPASSCARKRVATMTYSAFDFEVFGKVQGVFFRAATIKEAKKLGVVGHVKNTSSGTVTGEVQGEPKPASQMKDWLQHKGPSGAKIDKCSITNEKSDLDKLTYSSFEKR